MSREVSRAGIGAGLLAAAALFTAPAQANGTMREPLPPGNAAPTQKLPLRDALGEFQTPNRDLHGERAFWNIRIALNAAAIGCRGPRSAQLVADYNHLLGRHADLVRSSETLVIANMARSTGSNGIAARDKMSTRLFNYFAQPPAQAEFCEQAAEIAADVARAGTEGVRSRSTAMLARLDQPFVDFYHAFDRYRVELSAWQALSTEPRQGQSDMQYAERSRRQ